MGKFDLSLLASMILSKKGVRAVERGIELTLSNFLPTFTIREFTIEKISTYADIMVDNIRLEDSHFRQMRVNLKGHEYTLEDLEKSGGNFEVPHRPHSKVFIPIECPVGKRISININIKKGSEIRLNLERKVY
jgi:hypothetical protein